MLNVTVKSKQDKKRHRHLCILIILCYFVLGTSHTMQQQQRMRIPCQFYYISLHYAITLFNSAIKKLTNDARTPYSM
jgi:hypothetical protein